MKRSLIAGLLLASTAFGGSYLVEEGQARAEIVIAADAPRSTRLAARELQTYVRKITGASLAIGTAPTNGAAVKVYVGRSPYTEALGIPHADLPYGAYRIVSGENWLALIGDDTDFVPIEPWPRSNADIAGGRMQQAWNDITGEEWGYPHSQLHKHYTGRNHVFGTPREEKIDRDGNVNFWTHDERGSFNAVCGFLRNLGVRWYMPGELGEVLPRMDSIALPRIDTTVHPDFALRCLNFRAGLYGRDVMMWGCRLGTRQPFGRQAAHGLSTMTHNAQVMARHPDWFALYGGTRHTQPGLVNNQLCYSNEELLAAAVRYAQVQFDHYDMDVVSIMPPDGYGALCQCPLCEGKESPELGERGRLSNYVWAFVNRVAKQVAKTHPDRKISNCAYGVYTEPPSNIDKLEPNLQVILVGGRRPTAADRDALRRLRAAWLEKTDLPVEIFENYPFTDRGFYLPAYIPRGMGESINELKGIARGEDIWLSMDFRENAIGLNHFLVYFTARMYWGGTAQDAAAMFDEYVTLFYGPAAEPMRTFFRFCEENWREVEKDAAKAQRALELFDTAKAGVDPESVYGRRVARIDNYLKNLRRKSVQLAQKRGPVPKLRLVGRARGEIVVDGVFDDEPWVKCPNAAWGRLYETQTGRLPTYATSFKAAWIGNHLYFAITCEDEPGEPLNLGTTQDNDPAIWDGDAVEILLETESHSYYQLVVNPAGALLDRDRAGDRKTPLNWASQAEVATRIGDGAWTVEIRIPVTADENDPLHRVVGRLPKQSLPWHINLCRQRPRATGTERTAFAPTATDHFDAPLKFAQFYDGHSHTFRADPDVSDYVIVARQAARWQLHGQYREALDAYRELAGGQGATDVQVSDALYHAAACARGLGDLDSAAELAARIPLDAVAKTADMENRLERKQFAEIIARYGEEDLAQWPFWQIGAGAYARGRAYVAAKQGAAAEADLRRAVRYTPDARIRINILTLMGQNREHNLRDDDAALEAYRRNFATKTRVGAANEYVSVQRAMRILTRRGEYDAALDAFAHVDIDTQRGYWRHVMLASLGEALAGAGRNAEAIAAYRRILADDTARAAHRDEAARAVAALEGEAEE